MNEGCGKAYGSENSLNQHYKLKHEEVWAKIKSLCPELARSDYGDCEEPKTVRSSSESRSRSRRSAVD